MAFPFADLRAFIDDLASAGELRRVAGRVSTELEITEITDRVVKSGGPALLFENVEGSSMPVAINLFGTRRRMTRALGVGDYDDIALRIGELLKPEVPVGMMGKLKKMPQLLELAGIAPKVVRSGVCQTLVKTDGALLSELPVLKCWPGDGGKYITMGLTFCRDPQTGKRNVGVYRLQVFDDRRTGMHIHPFHDGAAILRAYENRGEPMPAAVAIGTDPVLAYAATAPTPAGFDELVFAGFLRKSPVELVKCKTIDLEVPAAAEIVLEGHVYPDRIKREGPFGDHTGFYSEAGQFPVFEVSAITTRRDPIYQTIVVGYPPMEDTEMGYATERVFMPVIRAVLPEVIDYHMPEFGVFHNWLVVAIDKQYAHHARKVASAVWGLGQMMLSKFVVILDADVDVHDTDAVMFHVAANVDPRRDTFIVDGPLDILDHASVECGVGAKMGIDATRKLPAEGHRRRWPEKIAMNDAIKRQVDRRWAELGLDGSA